MIARPASKDIIPLTKINTKKGEVMMFSGVGVGLKATLSPWGGGARVQPTCLATIDNGALAGNIVTSTPLAGVATQKKFWSTWAKTWRLQSK